MIARYEIQRLDETYQETHIRILTAKYVAYAINGTPLGGGDL